MSRSRTKLIPGFQSKELIIKGGLVLGDVDQYPYLDVTIDGADEWVRAPVRCLQQGRQ